MLPLGPLLLLALGLGLARTLNSNDPNVCTFWESFTTTTKESHSRPFSLPPAESCDRPWEDPHTCSQPKVVYRTVYRQVVKTDFRPRLQCCRGFYESSGACVPLCAQECVHGRCVAPNQCQCAPGWRGDDCSSECAPGVWGKQCDKHCACGNSSSCDPKSGACSCLSGLQPPNCLQPCPPGHYGPACQFGCHCHGAPCDPQDGACFCPPGRTGPRCVMRSQGFHGPNCSQECRCHNGGLCDRFTGQCHCAPGYTVVQGDWGGGRRRWSAAGLMWLRLTQLGTRCHEECPVGRFGQDCAETCDCAPGARCFPANGACLCEHGFTGDRCAERLCPDGLYGLSCQASCTCDPERSLRWVARQGSQRERSLEEGSAAPLRPLRPDLPHSCHPMHGECSCRPGWAGLHCNESCPQDTHGPGCQEHCLCLHRGVCLADSGLCRCAPGWQRGNCSVPCPPGTWGFSCNASCQCAHEGACSPQTGTCTCTPGWHGAHCQLPCPKGQFGEGCASRCDCDHSDGCDPVYGHCQCLAGWMGTRCHLPCPEGFWGANCSNTCTCKNGGTCVPESGNCVCAPGFRGPSCQRCEAPFWRKTSVKAHTCPPGFWGTKCTQPCQCHHGGTCHPQDGSCACTPGWTGPHCLEGCPPGVFGVNCSQLCQCGPGEKCHPETGVCICPPGHSGTPCKIGDQEPFTIMPTSPVAYNSLGAVIGITVLGTLVVALVALFIGYRHWQKGKEHQHLAVAYSTGRLDGSEYIMPDVPPSYSHYYSNPSYHTLSQCSPNPLPPNKVPGSQLFANLQVPERPGRAHGPDNHATLPADWKHRREPHDRGTSHLDRSYSCSYSHRNGQGPFFNKGPISEEGLGASVMSLSSENPYATIRDLPDLPGEFRESSYVEMKGPPSGSPPRQPLHFHDSQQRHPQPHRDSGTYEQPSPLSHGEPSLSSTGPPLLPPGHYDSPKNSHIPGHYDLPPVRHPPSPPLQLQDR
uniref:Platelet endothelial aggregation receptor 1 n=1 Tax=Nannospalax galili TaxID=1026970 RepID=A0A8C6QPT1_NANGA